MGGNSGCCAGGQGNMDISIKDLGPVQPAISPRGMFAEVSKKDDKKEFCQINQKPDFTQGSQINQYFPQENQQNNEELSPLPNLDPNYELNT